MKRAFYYISIILDIALGLFVLAILIRGHGTLADYLFVTIDFVFVIPLTIIQKRRSKSRDTDASQN